MKYFEFTDFDYYALIAAEDMQSAIDCYKEFVSDIEDENTIPDEITREEAEAIYNKAPVSEFCEDIFESSIEALPCVLVIDRSLV